MENREKQDILLQNKISKMKLNLFVKVASNLFSIINLLCRVFYV